MPPAAGGVGGDESDGEPPDSESSSDTSSSEDAEGSDLFFGPFAGATLAAKRARWRQLLGKEVGVRAGRRRDEGKKRRKVEMRPRYGRYAYVFQEGDARRFRLDPMRSPWWDLLNDPNVRDESSAAGRKFRQKFRLPYGMCMKLVREAQSKPEWCDKRAGPGHGRGPSRHPLVLKVLAALRHLGKGIDPETIEEGAQISASSLKVFIPAFVKWLGTTIYAREVRLPTGAHLDRSMRVYETLGFPGAYCSADGVHVPWDRAPSVNHHLYVGKELYPTLAWVVSVVHSREIIHVSSCMPGARNDKTQSRHAELFNQMRTCELHPERIYYLYDAALFQRTAVS